MTEPCLFAFEQIFAARLGDAMRANRLDAGTSLDENIVALAHHDYEALKKALNSAARQMFKKTPVPYNRRGDAVALYGKFVLTQLRTPKDRLWFNDVIFRIAATDEILDPLRVFVSDKELSKLYARAVLGEERTVPTLAVIENPADVDACDFPETCVIKPTHGSRQIIVRKPGEHFDRQPIKDWFQYDYYRRSREANYRTLRPKVIVEPFLFEGRDLIDLNVFCVEGEPRMLRMTTGVFSTIHQTCLSLDWRRLDIKRPDYELHEAIPEPPPCLEEVKHVASLLSARFNFIRIDFLVDGKDFYVGEITNLSGGAVGRYEGSGEREMSVQIFGPRALASSS